MTEATQSRFKKWYATNKATLAAKRAERYRNDPEYKQAIQDQRAAKRAEREQQKVAMGVSLKEACEILGVTGWTMNRWKNLKFIPLETLRSHRFTHHELQQLRLLKQFFEDQPKRSVALHRDKQDALVAAIHQNWKEIG